MVSEMKTALKIGLITSKGGHLFQLHQLKPFWRQYRRFWVTFKGKDVNYLLKKEKIYFGYYPESRNVLNAFRNLILAFKILRKERPDLLVSAGAAIAPPFFLAGKLMGCKLIFIEPYDFVNFPSLSGRLVYRLADKFIIQQKCQRKFFPKAEYWGATL